MSGPRKLQVFVSSTYSDLREERQAAVEAILSSGHIPAGMELFTAGDESQMSVIRRWIDESDVFLLILGGRYGSIELTTGKSYTHLEYEYALSQGKPLFAVVIDEAALEKKVRRSGRKIVEIENARQLKEFREIVLSRMVRFWSDPRDIKLAIHETMSEFSRRNDLSGWVPGNQAISTGILAEEVARVTRENAELRQQITRSAGSTATYNGLTFDEYHRLLAHQTVDLRAYAKSKDQRWKAVADQQGPTSNLLEVCWALRDTFLEETGGILVSWRAPEFDVFFRLASLGLLAVRYEDYDTECTSFALTGDGRGFILRYMSNRIR